MDTPDTVLTAIVYSYAPAGLTAKGAPAVAAGVASVMVSPAALVAIRSLILDDDGRLPQSARTTLPRIDEREATDPAIQDAPVDAKTGRDSEQRTDRPTSSRR